MDHVYLLRHDGTPETGESWLLIGLYRSEADARDAIRRLGDQPGFRDYPDGWAIHKLTLGQDVALR